MRCHPAHASRWRRGHALICAAALASPALTGAVPSSPLDPSSQDAANPVVEVTWPDIARAAEQHPRLAAGDFQVDAARGGARAAGAVPNPTVEATLSRGLAQTADAASRLEWSLSVNLPLGWIAQRGSKVDAAEAEVDAAVAERKALRREVLLQLRTLFWSLLHDQQRVASLKELDAQTAALVQSVRKRVEKGEVRPIEAIRVEIELEKVASELAIARTSLAARQGELALWLGLPVNRTLEAVADPNAIPRAIDRETALATLREGHPVLEAARARTRQLEAEVGVETLARVPSLGLSGFASSELDRRAYGAGVTLDLPLWSWNTGRIRQAEARLAAGRKQAEAAALELQASVLDAQAACQASVETATRYRDQVVPRSEAAAATIEKTHRLGEASVLEVIDARRTLLDARRLHLSALSQAQIDCSRLDALTGEDFK